MDFGVKESEYVWLIRKVKKHPRLFCVNRMDAEQYSFEDFDFDEPEPSTSFDQSSDWDSSADVTLTEDRLKESQTEETKTACKQLNHIKERQASIEKAAEESKDGPRNYVRLGSSGRSAFRSAKAVQRSSWAGSKSKAFFTHGRSRSWDFEDSGSGDMKEYEEPDVDNGFVRTGQGGTGKDGQSVRGILQNRVGAVSQNQRQSSDSNIKERTDLEPIGEQRQQEDKFSVRTRNNVHHVRWRANALTTKHIYRSNPHIYNGGPKLLHSASVDSSLPPNQSSPIRPAGLIDRKDRYQSTMHGELHSQRTSDGFGPVLQNRLPHQMKGQSLDSLPSAAERIRLFGPKDLIYDLNTQGGQLELPSRNSPLDLASSTDSGVSVSTTVESLESLEPEMARQLLMDIPPASLSPAASKLKRKPIVLPSDNPGALDKALGIPPSGRHGDTQTALDKVLGLPPSGRQAASGEKGSGDNLGQGEMNEVRPRPASYHW
ncbi:uncharacterized protein LOC121423020 [Lytechinus variegatus]|uniref:uncharacterized protein LOC121423020 n=1 Tax=Lytechinus variegatus TaxID=7654 RepID=UPI001BB17347|nr:uncharacterized protein LOC121423020 [Lytechinus variegatus]